jgi:TPR repeat protein
MEQGFIDILKQLVAEQVNAVLSDTKQFKSVLTDYTRNEYQKESRFLIQAVEAGVAKAIKETDDLPTCKKAKINELVEDYGLSQEVSAAIVDTLALVLRGDTSKSESAGNAESNPKFAEAKALYDAEEYEKAIPLLLPLAEQGHSGAQWMLGDCYMNGYGTENVTDWAEFERKSLELVQKSVDQGNIDGQVLLATLNKSKDISKSIEVFKKAADQGNNKGLYQLGRCYVDGEGLKQDKAKAVELWQKAVDHGDDKLKDLLGILKKKIEIDQMSPRPSQGKVPFLDGKFYEGDIADGKPCKNGKGKIIKPDGSVSGEIYFIDGKAYV